jgi:hypothetical protein
MKATNLKRIAATGAIAGALGFAALGLGAGVANADDGATPFDPGGFSGGDWESLIPMISQIGHLADFGDIGGLNGGLSGLNAGQLESLVGLVGG